MTWDCKEQQEKIEESVLQPLDKWIQEQEQRCKNEECKWWLLCLNKVFCWLAWVLVKITIWVMTIVIRWIYRTICTLVSLVVGVVALIFGNTAIIGQALLNVWELVKDSVYTGLGAVIYVALLIVDWFQTVVGIQAKKRPLTEAERGFLWPVFRNSLNYNAIRIVDGTGG